VIVEGHDRLRPWTAKASRLLVRDDHGNPLLVVVRVGATHTVVPATDAGFAAACALLGVDRTELADVEPLTTPPRG
jgi:hypothetical protein